MPTKGDIELFVKSWVDRNVRAWSGYDIRTEVDRLAAALTGDARCQGISGRDLYGALGDIDDYLTRQCQRVMPIFKPDT